MPFKRSNMRYGHIIGYTGVTYQDDGDRIISIGQDGDIRIWDGVYDEDPTTSCLAESIWAVLHSGSRILVATDLNTVQAYKYPELEKDGIEFRFTAFVTSLARNERFLAAGSEDGTIKVKPVDGDEFELGGLDGPVLSMDVSRKDLLAASCGDGQLRIWKLNGKDLVQTFGGLRKVKSFEGNVLYGTPAFEPSRGHLLAYPKDQGIVVVDTSSWEQRKVLKHPKISANFSRCAFSPRGDYVAAVTERGDIAIWEYKTEQLIEGEVAATEPHPIIGLAWHPKNNGELVICDDQGQVGEVKDVFESLDDGNDLMEMAEREANGDMELDNDMDVEDIYSKYVAGEKPVEDESDDDDENTISVNKLKSQYMVPEADDDLLVDMLGKAKAEDHDDEDSRSVASAKVVAKSFHMQEYFQPGSTPVNFENRYMCYNHVGIIRAHRSVSDEKENSIEVEFHDSSKHHGIHLNNYLNHKVAGLSETVVAMGCGSEVENKGSKLVCINLVSFGNREWSCTMPGTEEIIGVVASDKIVVVATDERFLRVFTTRGTQREVLSAPGPLVAMAAFGDHFLVAYHRSPANEDQQLNLMIVTCVKYKLRCRDIPLCLSPGAELCWLGYSDKGSPVAYDSAGILRIYHATANMWFPILDADKYKAGASDNLFIVTVAESLQQVQLIVCRGAKYPLTNPRPLPMNATFSQPLCDVEGEKGALEDVLMRSVYIKSDEAETVLKETAIKLFALACRSETEQRAKELVETIGSSQLVPIFMKYASKIKRYHLAESLAPLLPTFQQQEREEERQELETNRENAAMVAELQHITVEAVTRRDTTPKIKPMPMVMRKNPFKRADSASKSSPVPSNPLGHLTGKAIGFSSPKTVDPEEVPPTLEPENNENQPKNSATGPKFMPWFEDNKNRLKEQHPDAATDAELIKIGMRQFKAQNSAATTTPQAGTPATEKRKLDETDKGESGVAKLAKFGFTKN
ncbi:hypothetical protein quinque_004632 [Culex quinquefasciatus]